MKSLFAALAAVILLLLAATECPAQKTLKETLFEQIKGLPIIGYLELSPTQSGLVASYLSLVDGLSSRAEPKVAFKKSKGVSHELIIVSVRNAITRPGYSRATAYFFKDDGALIRSEVFNIGGSGDLREIKVVKYPDSNDYMLEIQTGFFRDLRYLEVPPEWQFDQRSYGIYQTYAFQDNHVRLVRLIDEDGLPIRNYYYARHGAFGPTRDYSFSDVERLLRSNNPVDHLEVLVWLNGQHHPMMGGDFGDEGEKSLEAYRAARRSPVIKKLIEEKQNSANYLVSDLGKWVARAWAKSGNPNWPGE